MYNRDKIEKEGRRRLERKLRGAEPGSVVQVTPQEFEALQTAVDIEGIVLEDVSFPEEENVSNGPIKPDLHVLGAKDDSGKVRLGLVLSGFNLALLGVGEVGTFGANKYTDNGWKSVPDAVNRYRDAMYRHLLAGDEVDLESGLLHMAHAAWNALAILQFMMEERHGFQNEKETSSSKTDSECV